MKSLQREFVEKHPGTGVILSPRHCKHDQAQRYVVEISQAGGRVLFDPQFYNPRTSRESITEYPYWTTNIETFSTQDFTHDCAEDFCSRVLAYQISELNVDEAILPGRYANALTESWFETQFSIANTALVEQIDIPVYSTIALGPDVIATAETLDWVIDEAIMWPTDGVYMVFRHPNSDRFLIHDDVFLYNILNALLSLEIAGKKVIVGYANQQMLITAAVGVHGLATGNFRNVRQFNPEIFAPEEDKIRTPAVWYYDSKSLGEFRIQELELAYRRGMQELFSSGSPFDQLLISASSPASVRWGQRLAFQHYLYCMHLQWTMLQSYPRADRAQTVIKMLDDASSRMDVLKDRGFNLGSRSFVSALEPSLSAVRAIASDRAHDLSGDEMQL